MGNDIDKLKKLVGTQARLASILGMNKDHVSKMSLGKREVPEYVTVIAELIEKLPPEDWPKRWKR